MNRFTYLMIGLLLACNTGCLTVPHVSWDEPPPKKKEAEAPQSPPIVVSEDINERNTSKKIQELTKELDYDENHVGNEATSMPKVSDPGK